jgi:hypothetical protein
MHKGTAVPKLGAREGEMPADLDSRRQKEAGPLPQQKDLSQLKPGPQVLSAWPSYVRSQAMFQEGGAMKS